MTRLGARVAAARVVAALICMTVGMIVGAADAGAQVGISGFARMSPKLDADDTKLLGQSSDALNTAASPAAGASQTWSNPKSGNSGTVTLQRVFTAKNMPCHALQYSVAIAKEQGLKTYNFTWCKTDAGQWKVAD